MRCSLVDDGKEEEGLFADLDENGKREKKGRKGKKGRKEKGETEEEKKKIINTVWERRQKDIEDAMKSVRGDAEIMAERIHDLREELAVVAEQESNATFVESLRQNINDIQWLILVGETDTHHA